MWIFFLFFSLGLCIQTEKNTRNKLLWPKSFLFQFSICIHVHTSLSRHVLNLMIIQVDFNNLKIFLLTPPDQEISAALWKTFWLRRRDRRGKSHLIVAGLELGSLGSVPRATIACGSHSWPIWDQRRVTLGNWLFSGLTRGYYVQHLTINSKL